MKKPEQILDFKKANVKTKQYKVEFYDGEPVIVNATSFTMAEVLAKAYVIHKHKGGWDVHKVTSVESGMYIGGTPEKMATSF